MANEKYDDAEDVVKKAFPEFDVVKKTKPQGAFLPPDGTTPDVKKLHRRYNSDAGPEEAALGAAQPPTTSASATHAVVVQPKDTEDAAQKRLTVLVKEGKIKAVQG